MNDTEKEQLKYIFSLIIWPAIVGGVVFNAVAAIAYILSQGQFQQ